MAARDSDDVKKLTNQLQSLIAKATDDQDVDVVVGYEAAYAVYVHEDLEAHHEVGQAKYLEQPAREYQPELRAIIVDSLKRGKTLAQSLLLAGLALQRESQALVPIDTGNLKASAFTRLEKNGSEVGGEMS